MFKAELVFRLTLSRSSPRMLIVIVSVLAMIELLKADVLSMSMQD
jgi:hypothetical protein